MCRYGEAETEIPYRHRRKTELRSDFSRSLSHRRESDPAYGAKSSIAEMAGPAPSWLQPHPVGGDIGARVGEAGVAEGALGGPPISCSHPPP